MQSETLKNYENKMNIQTTSIDIGKTNQLNNMIISIAGLYMLKKIWLKKSQKSPFKKIFETTIIFIFQYFYAMLRYGSAMSKMSQLYYINKPKIIYYKEYVVPGYEPVLTLFKQQMERGEQIGVQCCVYVKGIKVVDLCAYYVNNAIDPNLAYNDKTLQCVFSSGKSVESMVIAWLVDQKKLEYSQKISHYWPEFGQNGKENITIADLLRHEAGLALFDYQDIPIEHLKRENINKNLVGEYYEKKSQMFQRKTPRAYHGLSRGFILNEIVRRVDSKQRFISNIIREEICGPLNIDFYVSLPDHELSRVSKLHITPILWTFLQSFIPEILGKQTRVPFLYWLFIAFFKTPFKVNDQNSCYNHKAFNTKEWQQHEISSANGHGTAEALAQLASIMAQKGSMNGKQVISQNTWEQMHAHPKIKRDSSLYNFRSKFTQGGFNIYDKQQFFGKTTDNRNSFCGWEGYGGAILRWHPGLEIGFGYCMNLLEQHSGGNIKGDLLQKKVFECTKIINKKQTKLGYL